MCAADARRGANGAASGSERAASTAARACSDDVLHTKKRAAIEMIDERQCQASQVKSSQPAPDVRRFLQGVRERAWLSEHFGGEVVASPYLPPILWPCYDVLS